MTEGLWERLLLPENLMWAWRKAQKLYRMSDCLMDAGEIAAFDLDLEAQLQSIASDFSTGRYKLSPIRPIAQPKRLLEGKPRFRQYFQISVRDQVAWIAVVNALGPVTDQRMPAWSYGNRLFRPAWNELDEGAERHSKLNFGPYRHASGHLYRKFQHSWPLFRRHISLVARKMAHDRKPQTSLLNDLDDGEKRVLKEAEKLPYWDDGYWLKKPSSNGTLYYASIDLKKFYPSLQTESILQGLQKCCEGFAADARLTNLVTALLDYQIEYSGFPENKLQEIDLDDRPKSFDKLPTGLFVAGFLANVALLPIDHEVDKRLAERRDIAHFRFVDDHSILGFEFKDVEDWIAEYQSIIERHLKTVKVAVDKTEPEELRQYLRWQHYPDGFPDSERALTEEGRQSSEQSARDAAVRACRINGLRPLKLMTMTLTQVSALAGSDFEILPDQTKEQRLQQLRWLLLTDLPETEIRADTRVSFAASRIGHLIPGMHPDADELADALRRRSVIQSEIQKAKAQRATTKEGHWKGELRSINADISKLQKNDDEAWRRITMYHFELLFNAFVEHPDKIRLFLRLIDYCRLTGHRGIHQIVRWLLKPTPDAMRELRRYYAALFLQHLAGQIIRAIDELGNDDALYREKGAAREFLKSVDESPLRRLLKSLDSSHCYYERNALTGLQAITRVAAWMAEALDSERGTKQLLTRLSDHLRSPEDDLSSSQWKNATNYHVGVWVHLLLARAGQLAQCPSTRLATVLSHLDITHYQDWVTLRRYPEIIGKIEPKALSVVATWLKPSDGGLVIDIARNGTSPVEVIDALNRSDLSQAAFKSSDEIKHARITLAEWVERISTLRLKDPHDPRCTEWTALEILRQIISELMSVPLERDPVDVMQVHPSAIDVPSSWVESPSQESGSLDFWTWDSWRACVRNGPSIEIHEASISDYRFTVGPLDGAVGEPIWLSHRRLLGLLLWGLVRQSFQFPRIWNLRGQERSLGGPISADLARLPLSSATIELLEACLTARARENTFIEQSPELSGLKAGTQAADIDLDPSSIQGLSELANRVHLVQENLEKLQISVMQHRPRQLIPVSVGVLQKTPFKDDMDEQEELQ